MRNLMLASAMVCLIVGPAMAASTVTMELEVGGSNNGANCDNRVCFTPGTAADGQTIYFDANSRITWAVRLRASGTHASQSGDLAIRGVANFVFDLELYHNSVDPGNLVSTATFTSTANSSGNCGIEADPAKNPTAAFLTNAAFAYAFNVNSGGPARVFDWLLADAQGHKSGGPRMDVHCYPKAAAGTGKLFGMGAGYSSFNKDPNLTQYTTGGVGMGEAPSCPTPSLPGCTGDSVFGCLGWGPVAEGQIENLAEGTYVLRLIPGGGINILRNEATTTREVFALAADNASQGDTITFVAIAGAAPTIVGWSSVRSHGGVSLAIPLNSAAAAGSYTTETRIGGVQQIVVDFDQDITARYTPGQVTVNNGLALNGEPTVINGGTSLQINVTGAANRFCYVVDIAGAVTGLAAGQDTNCGIQVLEGDVTGEGNTDLTDVAQIKMRNAQSVLTNIKYDINCDGNIDLTDVANCKMRNANLKSCN